MTSLQNPITQHVVEVIFLPTDLTPHSPIEITSDAEFDAQAASESWVGNGSEIAPYVIENLNITTDDVAVHISNTSSYFVIQDCYLTALSDEETGNESRWSCILFLEVSNGLIDNCTVRSQRAAIGIVGSTDCEIRDSNLEGGGAFVTVWTNYATQCIVTNNTIHGVLSSYESSEIQMSFNRLADYSVFCINIQDSTISNNTADRIHFEGHDTVIANNSIKDSIQLDDSHNLDILSNVLADGVIRIDGEFEVFWTSHTILDNVGNGRPILYLNERPGHTVDVSTYHQVIAAGVNNCTFIGASFDSQPLGYLVGFCSFCWFVDTYGHNVSTLMDIRYSNDCSIANSITQDCDTPFFMYDCENCTVSENYVSDAQFGVVMQDTDECSIISNVFTDCLVGIDPVHSSNTDVLDNYIQSCGVGISVSICQNVLVRSNEIHNCSNGISISSTYHSIFQKNAIHNSAEFGFYVISGSNNTFFDNTLYENHIANALDDDSGNHWDDGISLGNYWDDYNGTGTYSIPGNAGSVDHYPRGPQVTSTTTSQTTMTNTSITSTTTTSTPATSTPPPTGDDNTVLILVILTSGIIAVAIVSVYYIRYRVILQRTIEDSTQSV
ncbi:MAG: NosD domain-containing protein [Candidatus Thorarchaeota archaeon]